MGRGGSRRLPPYAKLVFFGVSQGIASLMTCTRSMLKLVPRFALRCGLGHALDLDSVFKGS